MLGTILIIVLILLLMGVSIGFGQWLVLRRHLTGAGWWIAASLLGWGVLALLNSGNSFDQFGLLVIGFLPACTTAGVLALLVKQIPQAEPV